MEAIETLLTPVSPEHPCGESVRYSPEFDRLAAARQQDDETLPTGVWQSTPRRADWEEVARLACELTLSRSKDLVIMSWLGKPGYTCAVWWRCPTRCPCWRWRWSATRTSYIHKLRMTITIIALPHSAG